MLLTRLLVDGQFQRDCKASYFTVTNDCYSLVAGKATKMRRSTQQIGQAQYRKSNMRKRKKACQYY